MSESINALSAADLEALLIHVVADGGRAKVLDTSLEQALEAIEADKAIDRLRILLLALTLGYRTKAQESALAPLYLTIDARCVETSGRTRLQDVLLADYAAVNALKLQAG